MSLIYWRGEDETTDTVVTEAHPFPVAPMSAPPTPSLTPKFYSALTTTLQNAKVGEAYLHFLEASNINTTDAYIQLFDDIASHVTLGTTTPTLALFVPKGDGANRGAMDKYFDPPLRFPNGLSIAVTTTATGSTAVTTGLVVNAAVR